MNRITKTVCLAKNQRRDKALLSRSVVLLTASIVLTACGADSASIHAVTAPPEGTAISERAQMIEVSPMATAAAPVALASSTPNANIASAGAASASRTADASEKGASVAQPNVLQLTPASVPARDVHQLSITLSGRGFMKSGNSVRFGPITINDLPSADGSRITFTVPKLVPGAGDERPLNLPVSSYLVTVMTTAGVSNEVVFSLTGNP